MIWGCRDRIHGIYLPHPSFFFFGIHFTLKFKKKKEKGKQFEREWQKSTHHIFILHGSTNSMLFPVYWNMIQCLSILGTWPQQLSSISQDHSGVGWTKDKDSCHHSYSNFTCAHGPVSWHLIGPQFAKGPWHLSAMPSGEQVEPDNGPLLPDVSHQLIRYGGFEMLSHLMQATPSPFLFFPFFLFFAVHKENWLAIMFSQ